MTKFIKLLLGLTLSLILVAAIVIAGAILYFDPNQHKDFIISRVEKTTGRSFDISGNIDLTYYPWLGLKAEGITLGNASGFGEQPFFHADLAALRIKTLPLFKKHYELDTLRLHGLQVNLAKNEQGVTNWDDLVSAEPKKKQEPLQLAAVVLGGVDIQNARIAWHDAAADQTVRISDLNISTGELTYGAPVNLAVGMKVEASKPALKSDVKLNGTLNYDLDAEIYSFKPVDLLANLSGPDVPGGSAALVFKAAVESNLKGDTAHISDLNLEVLGTRINGDLTANRISSGQPAIEAQLAVKSDDLARLLALIDPASVKELARLQDRSAEVRLRLSANPAQGNVQVPELDAKLLGANIQGQVDAGNLQSNAPSAKGKLQASGPDLPALMQVLGPFAAGLKDLGLRLAKVTDKSFDIAAEFDADMKEGNIHVPALAVKTLGITANGELDAKGMNTSSGKVEGKFSLHGEKLAGVLAALDQQALGEVLQRVNIDAGVSGTGREIVLSPLGVKATFAGKPVPNSPAEVTLNADTRINLEKETLTVNNMKLQGLGLNVAGDVNGSRIMGDKPAVNGKLDARGSDLALIFRLAGIEPLATQLAGLKDRSFDIKAGLDADLEKGQVRLSNLDAHLLGATINGQVDAANIQSDAPSARGKLQASGPDLPALMQVLGQFEAGKEPKLKNYGQRLSRVADRSFDIAADFDADPGKGNINIPTLSARALGMTVNGQLNARDMKSKSGNIDGKISIKGEKLAGVLAAFGQAGLGEVLQTVSADAGVKGTGGDFALSPLQVKATFAGKQIPNSPVDMTLNATTRANLDKQTLTIENLSLQGLGLNVSSNLNATRIIDLPAFTGNLSIAEFNLRQLARQLNQTLPETADKNVFNKVALQTAVSGSTDSLSLKDLSLRLDETTVQGHVSVARFTQPDIQFGIGIDAINADRYLPPAAAGKPVTPETVAGGAASELPLDTLRSLRINGDLLIGQLIISNAKMTNVKLSIKAREGDIRLEPVGADLYQGKYQGAVVLDARGKIPAITVNTQLTGVQLDPLMKDYMQQAESPLAGVADITLGPLTANGGDATAIKRTMTGKGSFSVKDGVLRGVDVGKTLEQIEIMLESKRLGTLNTEGETRFQQLNGTLDINQGVVTNQDMLMNAAGFNIRGKGILANLNDESIKYNMKVQVDESSATRGEEHYNIGGYEVPVKCRGRLSKPDCKPDAEDIAKVLFKKAGEEKVEKLLEKALGIEKQPTAPAETTTAPAGPVQQPEQTTTAPQQQPQPESKSPEEQLKEGVKDVLKGLFN